MVGMVGMEVWFEEVGEVARLWIAAVWDESCKGR